MLTLSVLQIRWCWGNMINFIADDTLDPVVARSSSGIKLTNKICKYLVDLMVSFNSLRHTNVIKMHVNFPQTNLAHEGLTISLYIPKCSNFFYIHNHLCVYEQPWGEWNHCSNINLEEAETQVFEAWQISPKYTNTLILLLHHFTNNVYFTSC